MKKILFIIVSFAMLITPLYAQSIGIDTEGYERTEENNYGINKDKIKINDNNISEIRKTPYVDASKKIYDYADILSEEEESDLRSLIDGFVNETGLDFAFISVDFEYSRDDENDRYAYNFYDYNDFGLNNEYYGGIVLLRNKNEKDPYYTSYVFGEAQFYCGESRINELLDNLYPYFSNKNYKIGIENYLHQLKNYYDEGYDEDKYYLDENGSLKENYSLPYLPSIISGGLVSLLSVLGLVKKNKMVKKASNADDYLVKSSVQYINKTDTFVSTITTHHRISSDSGSHGGGSHSGFGSSGMGHIGGGRHG